MRKGQLLNSALVSYIANLGHGDITCIADAGLPIPSHKQKIDLSLERGNPDLLTMLKLISSEAVFETAFITTELPEEEKQKIIYWLETLFSNIEIKIIEHEKLKAINIKQTNAIIRTGENRPYFNVLLVSGVKF